MMVALKHSLAGLLMVAASTASTAATLPFIGGTSEFFSFINGVGTINGNGGQSSGMWTTGDYVRDSFLNTGLATANRITGSFYIQNYLGTDPADLLIGVYVNNALFGTVSVPQCNFCGQVQAYNFDFSSGTVLGDTYELRYELASTRFGGAGAMIFLDGGQVSLSTGAVPEPASWAMMIAGFGLVGAMARRRQTAAAV